MYPCATADKMIQEPAPGLAECLRPVTGGIHSVCACARMCKWGSVECGNASATGCRPWRLTRPSASDLREQESRASYWVDSCLRPVSRGSMVCLYVCVKGRTTSFWCLYIQVPANEETTDPEVSYWRLNV